MALKNSRSDALYALASLDSNNPHLDVAAESCLTLRYLSAMTAISAPMRSSSARRSPA